MRRGEEGDKTGQKKKDRQTPGRLQITRISLLLSLLSFLFSQFPGRSSTLYAWYVGRRNLPLEKPPDFQGFSAPPSSLEGRGLPRQIFVKKGRRGMVPMTLEWATLSHLSPFRCYEKKIFKMQIAKCEKIYRYGVISHFRESFLWCGRKELLLHPDSLAAG